MLIITKKQDIIWNYLGIFFSMATNVIWLPILVHYLPPDILGIWYVFLSIGAIVQLFDCGFNPTFSHSISYAWSGATDLKKEGVNYTEQCKEPNFELIAALWKACQYLYFGIALVASLCMLIGGSFYLSRIAPNYKSISFFYAWLTYILSIFVNLYVGFYSIFLRGIGKISDYNKANVWSKISFVVLGTIGLVNGNGILGLSIAFFISGIILRFLCKYYLFKKFNFKCILTKHNHSRYVTKNLIVTMWHNAWRDGLVTLTSFFNGQATVLLCSGFLSLYETGIYSFSMQVINAITALSNAMMSAYSPALQSAYVTKEKNIAKSLYAKSIAGYYVMSISGMLCFLIIGIPIVRLIRSDFKITEGYFILLAISSILFTRHRNSAWFISTMNKLPYTFSFFISGLLSVVFTYMGLQFFHLGLLGLIIIPLIVQSLFNNWYWNYIVNQYFKTNEVGLITYGLFEINESIKQWLTNTIKNKTKTRNRR